MQQVYREWSWKPVAFWFMQNDGEQVQEQVFLVYYVVWRSSGSQYVEYTSAAG